MNQAITYLVEPLLTQFFLLDAVCRGFIDEARRKATFCELAQVFGVPLNEEVEAYFEMANAPHYKNITDNAAYERLCRTIEFARHSGQEVDLTEADRVILAQKREAMAIKAELFEQRAVSGVGLVPFAVGGHADVAPGQIGMEQRI